MRKLLFLTPAFFAGCAASPATPLVPVAGESGYVCRNDALGGYAGQSATQALGADILRVSGAKVLRWIEPGMMVTMDFREDRVSVWLAAGNKIERVSCG